MRLYTFYLMLCLLLLIPASVVAQQNYQLSTYDLQLVCDSSNTRSFVATHRHVQYGFGNKRQRFNPVYHLLSSSMYVYQRCISPVIVRSCAFSPSCSGYSKALIAEYGMAKGIVFSADRLMRCNRISLADPITHFLINQEDGHIHESVDRYLPAGAARGKGFEGKERFEGFEGSRVKGWERMREDRREDKGKESRESKENKERDFDFAFYLVGSGLKEEALTLLKPYRSDADSLSFAKGYVFYSNHQLDSAVYYLTAVDSSSQLFSEARFYAALSAAHLKQYDTAIQLLQPLKHTHNSTTLNLCQFEQAGIELLQRNLHSFDSCYVLLQSDDFRIANEATALSQIRAALPLQHKSPWVAAGLSAVVPGLGKIYAGRLGEGLSAFLIVGSLMAATAENIYKEGYSNWKTWFFGTLTAVFHIGNIYGSAVTARIALTDHNNQTDVQILYHIHIPIRNSYRR